MKEVINTIFWDNTKLVESKKIFWIIGIICWIILICFTILFPLEYTEKKDIMIGGVPIVFIFALIGMLINVKLISFNFFKYSLFFLPVVAVRMLVFLLIYQVLMFLIKLFLMVATSVNITEVEWMNGNLIIFSLILYSQILWYFIQYYLINNKKESI